MYLEYDSTKWLAKNVMWEEIKWQSARSQERGLEV